MYRALLSGSAVNAGRGATPKEARTARATIDGLRRDPFASPNIAPLRGELVGLRRVRVGSLRIAVEIWITTREVFVHGLGPRGDIYRWTARRRASRAGSRS